MKIPASKYACPYCQGKGRIEIEGPGMESYASSCPHCHGSGERMIEIPLREYERLVQTGGGTVGELESAYREREED